MCLLTPLDTHRQQEREGDRECRKMAGKNSFRQLVYSILAIFRPSEIPMECCARYKRTRFTNCVV